MTFALAYWIIMLVWFLFGMWSSWGNQQAAGGNLALFVLLVLLGWKVFGPPIHG